MLVNGADPCARNKRGTTPFHLSSSNVAVTLLEHGGVNPDSQENDGCTRLHEASEWGKMDMIHMLVEHGANVSIQNESGDTPLHRASKRGLLPATPVFIVVSFSLLSNHRLFC